MAKLLPKNAAMPIAAGITKVLLRLKWDENSSDPTDPMDVDGFVMGRGADGKLVRLPGLSGHPLEDGGLTPVISGYFIAPGNPFNGKNPFSWITPAKDERTGAASGWDETTEIDLSKVPAEVTRLDVQISIYPLKEDETPNGHVMAMISNCAVELANAADGKAIVNADAQFQAGAMWGTSAIWFCSIVRKADGKWDFANVMYTDPSVTYYNDWMETVVPDIPKSNVQ